ncbi:retrovirus-related pol polyprotein from transposon TNT 1-94 [Tanacetum coccineum]
MSQDVLLTVMKSTAIFDDSMNLEMKKSESCNKCLDLEAELVKRKNMVERDVYTELLNSFAKLEKHCISLELNIQLNQQIFQEDKSCNNQNALEILEYFENNDLKAQLQTKDTTICKLKERIKSMRENNKEEKVKQDMDEIETINIELEHSLSKLLSENGVLHKEIDHLKKIYKDRFDSIKKTRALSKEHCESLIAQLNFKSMENANLKGQIQKKVFVTTALQNELRRLKGKNILDNDTIITNATTISPGMFKLDLDPLAPRFDANHDVCFLDFVNDVNVRSKSTSAKQSQQHNIWKPMGYPDCSLVSELQILNTYDREPLSAHELPSKAKSWLWHRQLSHLNFGTLNKLAKDGLARGIPNLKFKKDHLCSACALGKIKKSSHQPKAEDTNQEKLYLLHMDLCGPMHVDSINGKRYILVIVDDYSRFTWVKFLRSKDEAPTLSSCIKNIQVRLNATVRNVRTYNRTEFVNQTLREFYKNVGISHQTSVARTPQ